MNLFLFAISSAFFSAIAAILQKTVLNKTDATAFSFTVSAFNVLILLLYVSVAGLPRLTYDTFLIILIKTVLAAFAFLFVMISIKNFELSSVLPVLAFTPALVGFFAFLLLNEKLLPAEIAGLVLMTGGIYVLETGERNIFVPLKELLFSSKKKYILAAMLLFTASSIFDKLLIGHFQLKPLDFVIWQQLLALPVFTLIVITARKSDKIKRLKSDKNLLFIILAISLLTLLYRYLYINSLQYGNVAIALTLKRLSVLFAVAASGKLLGERNIGRKTFAVVLIILGGYFLYTG